MTLVLFNKAFYLKFIFNTLRLLYVKHKLANMEYLVENIKNYSIHDIGKLLLLTSSLPLNLL